MNSFESGFVKVTWNKGHLKVTCVMISKKMKQQNIVVVNVWTMKSFSLILTEVHSLGFCLFFPYCACKIVRRQILFILSEPCWIESDSLCKVWGGKNPFLFCVKKNNKKKMYSSTVREERTP